MKKFFAHRKNDYLTDAIAIGPEVANSSEGGEKNPTPEYDAVDEKPSEDVQDGVKRVEAVTLSWTTKELIVAYACIFLVFFVVSMEQQIQSNLGVYVTSTFDLLPLYSTTSIVSGIVGGIIKLPTAKFVDLIGRPEGFIIMTGLATLGLIMMAACRNVETYAAAQVFYWVGFDGMAYVLDVFMADTSSLKDRAFVFAFSTTPYIATTFIGPRAAQSFEETSGWPWAFGSFAIITPVITIPILVVFYANEKKARKGGVLVKEKSGRMLGESVVYYFWEFDVPFTHFIPQPTRELSIWDSYFYNYLQAVHDLSITNTGYVYNIYSIGSCFWAVVVAFAIRTTGRFKWVALYFGIPLELLGVGLMIHFRQPSYGIGYVIMCQIFIAFGGGSLVICEDMAVMAAAPHENVASMLALIGLFSSVGGAIGQAISGAIYTNTFPGALDRALPGNTTLNALLYGSLTVQLEYPIGTPERTAVIEAYGYSQKCLTIAATAFLIPAFLWVAIWKDFKVKELRQVKGRVL
ncbi:hypothetical protein B7494_g7035 [Chlorociboria aeruginascens]|nr:hypothetical protein B7494_g7035 [Chlorociboria aeruginascens]